MWRLYLLCRLPVFGKREKPLFAFNFWSFAFISGFCTILHLLVSISHSHIYRPRRSHDEHSEPKETNVTLV